MNITKYQEGRFLLTTSGLILLSILYSLFSIFSVAMIMPVINYIFDYQSFLRSFGDWTALGKPSPNVLLFMIILAWIIFLLKNIFYFLSNRFTFSLERKRISHLGEELYRNMLNEPVDQFFVTRHAERLNLLTAWLQKYVHTVTEAIVSLSRALPLLIGYFIILLSISWSLTLIMLIALPFMTWIAHVFNNRLRKITDQERDEWDSLIHTIHQALSSIKLIRLFHSEKHEMDNFRSRLSRYLQWGFRKTAASGFSVMILEMIGVTFGLILLFMTGYGKWIGDFQFGPGGLVLFIASVFSMIDPAKWTVRSFQDFKEAASIRCQLNEYDHYKIKNPQMRKTLNALQSEIRWNAVSYRYPANKDYIFRKADLIIYAKDRVLITGVSGVGKSTFIDLTAGLLAPESGLITIDGIDSSCIDPALFGVLTQEPFLFNDTVRYNLNYPSRILPDHVLRHALSKVQLDEWIEKLPDQLDTIIGERGATMSGGEKQRLTLARLLLRDPQIILLDEATSGMDVSMESELMEMVLTLFHDRTIIMISHRPSVVPFANRRLKIMDQTFVE